MVRAEVIYKRMSKLDEYLSTLRRLQSENSLEPDGGLVRNSIKFNRNRRDKKNGYGAEGKGKVRA